MEDGGEQGLLGDDADDVSIFIMDGGERFAAFPQVLQAVEGGVGGSNVVKGAQILADHAIGLGIGGECGGVEPAEKIAVLGEDDVPGTELLFVRADELREGEFWGNGG